MSAALADKVRRQGWVDDDNFRLSPAPDCDPNVGFYPWGEEAPSRCQTCQYKDLLVGVRDILLLRHQAVSNHGSISDEH
jgi:hypothetical protein